MSRFLSIFSRVLLLLASSAISLWLADAAFVFYERSFLLPPMPTPGGESVVDLAALNYNDTRVERISGPDEFRILSFGDSFGYSIMRSPLAYAGVLQQRLTESEGRHRFRVVNLAEPATSVDHYAAAYAYWSKILQHDAVLFHIYLGNDIIDIAYEYAPMSWEPNRIFGEMDSSIADGRARRIPHKYPLRMLDYAYALAVARDADSSPPTPEHNMAAHDNLPEATFRETLFVQMDNFDPKRLEALMPGYLGVVRLFELAERLQAQGVRVAIALGPNEAQVKPELRAEILKSYDVIADDYDLGLSQRIIARISEDVAPHVPLIDLVPYFQAQHERRNASLYYRRNTHWDREGNQLAGELIASTLLERWFNRPTLVEPELTATAQQKRDEYEPGTPDPVIEEYVRDLIRGMPLNSDLLDSSAE